MIRKFISFAIIILAISTVAVAANSSNGMLTMGDGFMMGDATMSAGYMFIGDNLAIVDTADTMFNLKGGTFETNYIKFISTTGDSDDGIFNLNGGTWKFMFGTATNSSQNNRDLALLNSIIADDRFIVHDGDSGWFVNDWALLDAGNVAIEMGGSPEPLPEPATIALVWMGVGFIARRKRK